MYKEVSYHYVTLAHFLFVIPRAFEVLASGFIFSAIELRARDHGTSSTLIGGKVGADPSSRHTMLEGPTK